MKPFDLTIHDVDILNYLVGRNIESVYASGGKSRNPIHEDFVNLLVNFEGGSVGHCETNWLAPMKVREVNITTTRNYVNINYLTQCIAIFSSQFENLDESNLSQVPLKVSEEKISLVREEPLRNELIDFLEAIKNNRQPLVSGREGCRAIEIVQAGLESMRTGSVIKV